MTPTGGETSLRNAALLFQLHAGTRRDAGHRDAGHWIVFDGSTGFRLPDGSVLSPDASLLSQANGAQFGWLLLPEERAVEIWRSSQKGMAKRLENVTRLEAGEEFAGLALDLEEIWAV